MKGFNTDRIKNVIDGPIDKLTSEFVSFTMDIQRLIEMQRRYGSLDIKRLLNMDIISKKGIEEIEKALFNPDKVDWLSKRISELEDQEEKLIRGVEKREIEEEKPKKEMSQVNIDKLIGELKLELYDNSFRLIKEYGNAN